ncbi:MAG: NAD+ synthase [Candidatus Thorarchaeota archaeon]|nr:NAD+ synthase [Candidatus Thorarchaeota archaeon]
MKIAMAQINPTVGDFSGNAQKILDYIARAKEAGANIVTFPEMAIAGYPPQDLLLEQSFLDANRAALNRVVSNTPGITAVVGFVDFDDEDLFNAAAIIQNESILRIVHKTLLPTYDVFDEARYFTPSGIDEIRPIDLEVGSRSIKAGVQICEDLWDDEYDIKVTDLLVNRGAQLILNISASPFYAGKRFKREEEVRDRAVANRVPIFLTNLVGGQDELVFSGQSVAIGPDGSVIATGEDFEEDLIITELNPETMSSPEIARPPYDKQGEIFNALVLGIRDYFRKTGFQRAVLGLSGGIDSSLTACIAAEALGPENVIGISMPSKFSSDHSISDAKLLAESLGIHFVKVPIQEIVDQFHTSTGGVLNELRSLHELSQRDDDPVANENIQPRVRGNILMDISNRFRDLRILVLNTGNKTELALGYCTLYGDMTGGVGVIGDVSKLQVYALSKWYNKQAGREIIPRGSIEKKPSAELKPDQYDPFDFDIVSPMVDEIIENRRGRAELIEMGYSPEVVKDVYDRVRRAEYKRWQAPPCIRITRKAFGTGWKMPIVNEHPG